MSDTTRRSILRSVAATTTGLATVAGTASATEESTADTTAETLELYDDFTWGLYGWEVGTDLPEGIEGTVEHSTEKTASGYWDGCVKTFIEGYQDDGTVWLQTSFGVEPGTTYDVEMAVSGYNPMDSFQDLTFVHAALGDQPVDSESDIRNRDDDSNVVALKGDLRTADEQWQTYTASGTFESGDSSTAHFAFGTNLIYEVNQTDYLDDVAFRMTPR